MPADHVRWVGKLCEWAAQSVPGGGLLAPRTSSKRNYWTILNTIIILLLKSQGHVAFTKQICKTNKDGTTLNTKPTINYLDSLQVQHSTKSTVSTFDVDISILIYS